MHVDETDFSSMGRAEQIRHLEVEGYVAFPSILRPDIIARIKRELADAEMLHTSYSAYQTRSVTQPQWVSRAVAELIGYPPVVEFLRDLVGPDIVFTRGFFQRTLPGSPGISMHTDGQPHGSNLFGYEGSCPRLLRVLYYLDDLTRTRAPFRLIPRSHLVPIGLGDTQHRFVKVPLLSKRQRLPDFQIERGFLDLHTESSNLQNKPRRASRRNMLPYELFNRVHLDITFGTAEGTRSPRTSSTNAIPHRLKHFAPPLDSIS